LLYFNNYSLLFRRIWIKWTTKGWRTRRKKRRREGWFFRFRFCL